jgi:GntR family transcriptional regulator
VTADPYLPRYREIEQALRERIAELRPGDALPSDAELVEEFGVSRMTARAAVQLLVDEGLVSREPGRGTFVVEAAHHRRADSLVSFSNEMRRQGRVPSSRLLERSVRAATAEERQDLGLPAGSRVVALRRIRLADGQAIVLESASLPEDLAEPVLSADLEGGSLHDALIRGGHVLRRGYATISAEAATADDARHLGVRAGDPLLVERRVIRDDRDRLIERTESRYPGDRYGLDVAFHVEASAAHRRRDRHAPRR